MSDLFPGERYAALQQKNEAALALLQRRRRRLGWARLGVFVLTAVVTSVVVERAGWTGLLPAVVGLSALLALVFQDASNNDDIAHTRRLIRINAEERAVLRHDFAVFDEGRLFEPQAHAYATDLDLFGSASLYQYINRCRTEEGRQRLASGLLEPLDPVQVRERQAAVREWAPALEWRQRFSALAEVNPVTLATRRHVEAWLADPEAAYASPAWSLFIPVYSAVTIGSLAATLLGYLPPPVFFALFTFYYIVSLQFSRKATRPAQLLSGIVKEIGTLQSLAACLQGPRFSSDLLRNLQSEAVIAGTNMKGLKALLDRFDLRLNVFAFLVINSFLLWDVRQVRALNRWRVHNRDRAPRWFTCIAEAEVINSLCTLHVNNPGWSFPEIAPGPFLLEGSGIGHPLLPAGQRVTNDFSLAGTPKIGLITGSNMAGKSTILRSLGVNLVLAQLGAPVCANTFRFSPVALMSSMRVADNLAENTSTFYAELKKLKTIIDAVNRHENVFILLDEILRGTNSLDRHTGSAALIRQLVREDAVAVLATHDVALAGLQSSFPDAIENYHFDVQVAGEELYFDYRLKPGVCQSLNASLLMKKIGIRLD
ncbi:MAG: hypothetical protein JWP27_515 [Flaviaesturariibacter sp.]|nr:hypothetical protein [Flaviaesturariibacter sp.]